MRSLKWLAVAVVLFVMTLVSSCTLHFKGKDVELETHSNKTYELRSVGVLKDADS